LSDQFERRHGCWYGGMAVHGCGKGARRCRLGCLRWLCIRDSGL
jgi:hypothetical protein